MPTEGTLNIEGEDMRKMNRDAYRLDLLSFSSVSASDSAGTGNVPHAVKACACKGGKGESAGISEKGGSAGDTL